MNWAELIPKLPDAILEAASKGELVLFVGSGVSQPEYPGWIGFADKVLNELTKDGKLSYGERDLFDKFDAKRKLSVAVQIFEEAYSEKALFDFYRKTFKPKEYLSHQLSGSYKYLNELECVMVTTNYDTCLDKYRGKLNPPPEENPIICKPKQFLEAELRSPPKTIHLHGSVNKPESMIVTAGDYLELYSDKKIEVQNFLKTLFDNFTVLFLGYGLDEPEILEFALQKGLKKGELSQKPRFLLQGYFNYQECEC